jgi:hypothetical protein
MMKIVCQFSIEIHVADVAVRFWRNLTLPSIRDKQSRHMTISVTFNLTDRQVSLCIFGINNLSDRLTRIYIVNSFDLRDDWSIVRSYIHLGDVMEVKDAWMVLAISAYQDYGLWNQCYTDSNSPSRSRSHRHRFTAFASFSFQSARLRGKKSKSSISVES